MAMPISEPMRAQVPPVRVPADDGQTKQRDVQIARAGLASGIAWISRWARIPGLYVGVADPLLRAVAPRSVIVRRYGSTMRLRLDDYVQRRVFCWSLGHAELEFTRRWCREGDTMIDVGANVGVFSLVASRAVGRDGAVVSIEANPTTVCELEANIARNQCTNVQVVDAAVGEQAGIVSLGMIDARQGSGAVSVAGTVDVVTVVKTTLDDVLRSSGQARLVKIDVEGFEPEVLTGANATLSGTDAPQVVLVEVNEVALCRLDASGARVCAMLRGHGYRLLSRSLLGTLRAFRPLDPADVRAGISVVGEPPRTLRGRLRRVLWARRLLVDVVAVHPDTSLRSVRRAYRRRFLPWVG